MRNGRVSGALWGERERGSVVTSSLLSPCSALWGERDRERCGECHKKSSPAQEESDSESTGPAK